MLAVEGNPPFRDVPPAVQQAHLVACPGRTEAGTSCGASGVTLSPNPFPPMRRSSRGPVFEKAMKDLPARRAATMSSAARDAAYTNVAGAPT